MATRFFWKHKKEMEKQLTMIQIKHHKNYRVVLIDVDQFQVQLGDEVLSRTFTKAELRAFLDGVEFALLEDKGTKKLFK